MAFAPRPVLLRRALGWAAALAVAAAPAAAPAQSPPAQAPAGVVNADVPDLFGGGGVVRAGYVAPAGGPSGVVRTSAEVPVVGALVIGAPAALALGAPVADLDFLLAPKPAAPAAEPETSKSETAGTPTLAPKTTVSTPHSVAKPAAPARPAPAVEAGPRPGKAVAQSDMNPTDADPAGPTPVAPAAPEPTAPPAFSAADFGFGPAAPAAPAAPDAPKQDGAVKTADATADPAADPFAVVPAAAAPDPEPEPAPVADPFAPNPLSDNPLAADEPPPAPTAATNPAVPAKAAGPARVADAARDGARPSINRIVPDAAIDDPAGEEIDAEQPIADAPIGGPTGDGTTDDFASAADFANAADGPQTAALGVRVLRTGPVRLGRPCTAELIVRNDGPADAAAVVVTAQIPAGLRLADAAPTPDRTARGNRTSRPSWVIPALAAGERRTLTLTLIPEAGGPAKLAAGVRGTVVAADPLVVTEPKIAVEIDGPDETLLGEPATQTIAVSNPGSGAIDEVILEVVLPDGLEHRGGPKRLTMNVGALAAGETKPVRLALVATAGGAQTIAVTARGEAGLSAAAARTVEVASPQIELAIAGPSLRYVNRDATIALTVTNPGDAATDNVRLGYRVPEGFAFLTADASGTHDPAGRTVRWFLGRVDAGASRTVTVDLKATAGGEQTHRAEVSASSRAKASAEHVTRIEGTASLVLTIEDSDDPVEVGSETVYTVTVANEGTAPAKTVGLACRLPEGCETGPVRGPAASRREGRLVLFDSLPDLAPGKRAVYTLRVKGTTAGSKRFQTRLVSDSISEPLIHEEITKFYAE